MARRCVFCGGPANSREDAFPVWLDQLAPADAAVVNTREDGARWWQAGGFDVKVRRVCQGCNNGWMSDLEKRSQALVTELATGQRAQALTEPEQATLSTWAFKTGVMLALAYPASDQYVPADDYVYLYENDRPPDGTTIFIAAVAPETHDPAVTQIGWAKPERLAFHRSDGSPMDAHGYRISFSVYSLVVQILRSPHGGAFVRPREFADAWTTVFPPSDGRWPPGLFFDAAGLTDIAGGDIFTASA